MIGVSLSKDLMTEVAEAPSKLGMTMSIKTRSNFTCSTAEMALNPSVTTTTVHPYFMRNFLHNWMQTSSSSTSKTCNAEPCGLFSSLACGFNAELVGVGFSSGSATSSSCLMSTSIIFPPARLFWLLLLFDPVCESLSWLF